MSRDFRLHLDDILESIRTVREYTRGMDAEAFYADRKTQDAVLRHLGIIGEAVGRLPEEITMRCPDIDWRKIIGLRNILVHEYFGISLPLIWDVIENKLGSLDIACEELLRSFDPAP